ncbi:nucleotidyltransferase [Forsythia ovata]|uniref:Nucleotidyltransferase n=1 Tax=Forsythia ovata TaxID=205694 RepID=A0ABD1QR52_9LAMI
MGEHEGWAEPSGPLPNGLLPGAGPVMRALDTERWMKAEERTSELIARIQPNQPSDERRKTVADYVQRLIKKCFSCQVCTFGSVPLKTYLPDGDIDLTAFSHDQNLKDTWANQVRDMLGNEEKNESAEFHVKEVQYIQAEVKIIKCLVENIVVDISFNQVGGLCTLCFLDEVDNLINKDHLFKRSIILIKAWCYYESRILGAHHGLISTYALETLVLYIFHIFNSSFYGPLEVLYRFLEFFSNFDWDNFCVSLWGPVPISSLPDVTAEPPRKDRGELLLSKMFLDACSSVYAVFPGGQENNGQPFISKHFNVIDPLRVNNNLGRSVSKGNFFRIRSAFAYGAKRLARLLDCPKENLLYEINQFFMNTGERHGNGHRPDAPGTDLLCLRLSTPDSLHEYENSKNNMSGKKLNDISCVHAMGGEGIRAPNDSSQNDNYSAGSISTTSEFSAASQTQRLNSHINLNSVRRSDQIGRDNASNQVVNNDKVQRDLKLGHLVNDVQGRFVFTRTRSSPELTDTCGHVPSELLRSRRTEISKMHANSVRLDASNRKDLISESLASHSSRSSVEDTSFTRHVPSHQSLDTESNSGSNSHHRESGLDTWNEELSSTPEALGINHEEKKFVNMVAFASHHGLNGQIPLPFNLASAHIPFPVPPSSVASMGFTRTNLPGLIPTNIPLIDPSFSNFQFPQGLVSPQLTHYFPGVGLSSPSEDSADQSNENFGLEINSGEADEFWQEQDVDSSGGCVSENGNFSVLQSDKMPESLSGLKYVPPSQLRGAGCSMRIQLKHTKEKHGSMRENSGNPLPVTINSEVYTEETSESSRFLSAARSNFLRSSRVGSSVKMSKSTKEKWGKKIVSTERTSDQFKGKNMLELISNPVVDDDREWGSLSNLETEVAEKNMGFQSATSFHAPRHHMPGFDVAQTSGSDSMIPIAPMLIGPGSRQRVTDNSGATDPISNNATSYNIPSQAGTSHASTGHFDCDESLDTSASGQNFSPKGFEQSEDFNSSSSLRGTTTVETSDEQKSDILNSDFASHWQSLQFGRFCQNPQYHGPVLHPSPVMVPPVHLQGHFSYDNPDRPLPTDMNPVTQLMTSYGHHLVPVAPLHSVSGRPPHGYQRYVDDMPRYRSGTGTYLPNPKVSHSVRERHSSSTRRGNYNFDRSDSFADREGNWNANSKSRSTARGHNRGQAEKSNMRIDRLASGESRAERPWSSYRHDSVPSYHSQNGPMRSNSSQNNSPHVAYGLYPLPAMNSSGMSSNGPSVPPVVMLYPFDHDATYGSHGEQLEFGSLGPVGFPGINEQSQLYKGSRAWAFEEHGFNRGSGPLSSPDRPSSPHHPRRL